jgi:tetratricopeptide (TPR) repeat protein
MSHVGGKSELGALAFALAAIATAFWAVHTVVVGGFAGDHANMTFVGVSFHDRALTMLGLVPEWARLLFAPAHLQVDYMPQEVARATSFGLPQLWGALMVLATIAGAVRAWRRQPTLTFAACWVGASLVPVSNVIIPSGVTIAERTLFTPSVGTMLAVGVAVSWLASRTTNATAIGRRLAVVGGAVVLALGAARSATRQPVWRNSQTTLEQMLTDSPNSYRTHWWHARRLFGTRDSAGAEREFRVAVELFPHDAALLAETANHYETWNRCDEAIPLYRRSLDIDAKRPWLHGRLARCLARLGRIPEARAEAAAADAPGYLGAADDVRYVDSLAGADPARAVEAR